MRLRPIEVIAAGVTLCALASGCADPSLVQVAATDSASTRSSSAPTSAPPSDLPSNPPSSNSPSSDSSADRPSDAPSDLPSNPDGSALAFDLPPGAGYQAAGGRVADDGAIVRRWRLELADSGLYCVVIAGEQPDYHGAFPASVLAAFRANRDPGGSIQLNQATRPIPGTVAGVRQQSSYLFSVGTGRSATGELMIRQYLTRGGTLISLNVAGPANAVQRCQLASIVESLRVSSQPTPTIGERTP